MADKKPRQATGGCSGTVAADRRLYGVDDLSCCVQQRQLLTGIHSRATSAVAA